MRMELSGFFGFVRDRCGHFAESRQPLEPGFFGVGLFQLLQVEPQVLDHLVEDLDQLPDLVAARLAVHDALPAVADLLCKGALDGVVAERAGDSPAPELPVGRAVPLVAAQPLPAADDPGVVDFDIEIPRLDVDHAVLEPPQRLGKKIGDNESTGDPADQHDAGYHEQIPFKALQPVFDGGVDRLQRRSDRRKPEDLAPDHDRNRKFLDRLRPGTDIPAPVPCLLQALPPVPAAPHDPSASSPGRSVSYAPRWSRCCPRSGRTRSGQRRARY